MDKFHNHELGDAFEWEGGYYTATPFLDDPNSAFNLPHMLVCCGGVDKCRLQLHCHFLNSLPMNIVMTVNPFLLYNLISLIRLLTNCLAVQKDVHLMMVKPISLDRVAKNGTMLTKEYP